MNVFTGVRQAARRQAELENELRELQQHTLASKHEEEMRISALEGELMHLRTSHARELQERSDVAHAELKAVRLWAEGLGKKLERLQSEHDEQATATSKATLELQIALDEQNNKAAEATNEANDVSMTAKLTRVATNDDCRLACSGLFVRPVAFAG